ncbi:MAG TPA: carboxypeptidase-like regulatory domain-containing protein [Planctomycetota bacterium]|nr:carboxypeptidase-like regulatory domain-containing protein [Planctomycetota bacterium]
MSRRRGSAIAVAALALLVALVAWLMRDGRPPAAPERGAAPVAAVSHPLADMPRLVAAPSAIDVPVAPEAAMSAPAAATTARAHRAWDGLVSLDDDGLGISGRVVDGGGQPIAGARLLLVSESWGIDTGLSLGEEDRGTSDADGHFSLCWDKWVGLEELRLYVAAPGWAPWIGRIAPVGDGPDIVLGPVQSLPLRLVFEDGGPVADALVRWEVPTWEHAGEVDLSAFTDVGRTDERGVLLLPVPVARADVSLVVRHDLHVGRHLVPLAAWRAQGASEPFTLTLPRGAALELLLDDWSDAVLASTPFVSLGLEAYERQPDGSLVLAKPSLFARGAGQRGSFVEHGRARATDLTAPAYRVTLWSWGSQVVLNQCWTPVPGLTTWHHLTPRPDGTRKSPLVVEFAATEGTLDDAWGGLAWHLQAERGQDQRTTRIDAPSRPLTLRLEGDGPVTLRLLELGDAGVRENVPPEGTYRFVLDSAVTRAMGGRLRIDWSGLARPPHDKDVRLSIRPEGGEQRDATGRSEVGGIPPGPCQVWIHAPGVEDAPQPVSILIGQTTVLAARARTTRCGTVRGRVVVHGNDDWLRLVDVRFRDSGTGAAADALNELGLQSFTAQLEPGHYTGEVHVGRLARAEECAAIFDDVTMLDRRNWSDAPVTVPFRADVRLGEITDVVVEVDAAPAPAQPADGK